MVSDSSDGSNWIGKYPALKGIVDAFKHYRGIIAATLLGAFGSAILIFWLSPAPLVLPAYEEQQTANARYHPGGSGCRPEVLSSLARSERTGETDRCRDAAEEYRLKQQDLIQQTRAANAATAGVEVGSEMARMTLAGIVIGFLTVIAAGMAAWYARKAFVSADKQTTLHERQMHMLSRPFVYIDKVALATREDGRKRVIFDVKNIGASPAKNLRCESYVEFDYLPIDIKTANYSGVIVTIPLCPPNVVRKVFDGVDLPQEDGSEEEATLAKYGVMCVGIRIIFDTPFKFGKVIEDHRYCRVSALDEGAFYLNTTITDPHEPEFDMFDERDEWEMIENGEYEEILEDDPRIKTDKDSY